VLHHRLHHHRHRCLDPRRPHYPHGVHRRPAHGTGLRDRPAGTFGDAVVALGLAFFAFSTILGWGYYGERAIEYLLGEWSIKPYRVIFVFSAFLGAAVLQLATQQRTGLQLVWDFSDMMNGAMAIPNLIGLLILSPLVFREVRGFFQRTRGKL
jgi:alanine or glycine:cation symporter, AGCS family